MEFYVNLVKTQASRLAVKQQKSVSANVIVVEEEID
jgi:hypothetical protein